MELWLDSADRDEIRAARQSLLISGHTTNQSLILKSLTQEDGTLAPCGYRAYQSWLPHWTYPNPVSLQLTQLPPDRPLGDAFMEGLKLRRVANNVVITVPVFDSEEIPTEEVTGWLWLVKEFRHPVRDFPVNVTNIFTKEQALLALEAGATYVSFFVGTLEDHLKEEEKLRPSRIRKYIENEIKAILSAIRKQRSRGKLIVASIRTTEHVVMAETLGAHIAAVPYNVLCDMMSTRQVARNLIDFGRMR